MKQQKKTLRQIREEQKTPIDRLKDRIKAFFWWIVGLAGMVFGL